MGAPQRPGSANSLQRVLTITFVYILLVGGLTWALASVVPAYGILMSIPATLIATAITYQFKGGSSGTKKSPAQFFPGRRGLHIPPQVVVPLTPTPAPVYQPAPVYSTAAPARYCTKCSERLEPTQRFCPRCGTLRV